MRTLTLDLGALEVETFTIRSIPWTAYAAADTADAGCETETKPTAACEPATDGCETPGCTEICSAPPVCIMPSEMCPP